MRVIPPLPLASKPGTCSAIVSVNRNAPRSTSNHTAHAVMTLVFEYSSHSVSSAAGCRDGSRLASPNVLTSPSFPRRASAIWAPGYRTSRMCCSIILSRRSRDSGANPSADDVDDASGKVMTILR
jgi:hypothetical protein